MINFEKMDILTHLAKKYNLVESEPEEYILTKEEEELAILNAVEARKKHTAWKMADYGLSAEETLKKLSEIDFTKEINRGLVLKAANSAKHQDLWHKEQRKKEREAAEKAQKELEDRCDARYMFSLMKWASRNEFGKDLIVNNYNKRFITAVCFFLSRDSRFETELGFSFKKGLLVRGIAGVGKTHIVRCVSKNELNPVGVYSMIEITNDVKQDGDFNIQWGGNKVIYLDDVGTEEHTVNHYGTKISFFKNFIESAYLKHLERGFNWLIISTNNSFAEIEDKYGFRVRSRMKDMFNVIDLKGEDMRGCT